jgi:hypothetical protein
MCTTTMPGFSADASLCRSRANYQVASISVSLRQAVKGMIQPALPPEVSIGCYHYYIVDRVFSPRAKLLVACCHAEMGGYQTETCCDRVNGCRTS